MRPRRVLSWLAALSFPDRWNPQTLTTRRNGEKDFSFISFYFDVYFDVDVDLVIGFDFD